MIRFWGQLPGQDEAGWNTVNNVNQVPASVNELQINNKPMIRVSSVGSQNGEIPPYLDAADKARFQAALAQGQGDWMAAEGAPDNAKKYANLTNRGGSMIGNFLDSYMNNPLAVAGTVFGGLGLAGAGPLSGLSGMGSSIGNLFSGAQSGLSNLLGGVGEAGTAGADAAWGVNPRGDMSWLSDLFGGADPSSMNFDFGSLTPEQLSQFGISNGIVDPGQAAMTDLGFGSSGLTEGGTPASDQGFVPGSFDLGTTAGGGTAASGLSTPPTGILQDLAKSLGLSDSALQKLLLGAGQAGLGLLGAKQQSDALKDVTGQQIGAANAMQDKWLALGAPSRARFEGSFAPGFDLAAQDPGFQNALDTSAQTAARAYSAKVGNPQDNPGAQGEINKYVLGGTYLPQLNTYRSQNLTGGQLGTNTAGTAGLSGLDFSGQAGLQNANNAGQGFNSIGYGLNTAFGGDDLESLLKRLGGYGVNLNLGTKPP